MANEEARSSKKDYMLTTIDNPFDPFDQFDSWFQFDIDKGYNTCAYIARIARTSDQLSDAENEKEIDRAINEIIEYDFMHIYRRVFRKSATPSPSTP